MEQIGPSSLSSDDLISLKIKSEQPSSLKGAQSQVTLSKSSTGKFLQYRYMLMNNED